MTLSIRKRSSSILLNMNNNGKLSGFQKFKKDYGGIVWCIPVLLGILIFTLFPLITSLYWSLGEYRQISSTLGNQSAYVFKGLYNYIEAFTDDWGRVWGSFKATFIYALVTIPTGLVGSYALALFLNQKLKGVSAFRVLYYLPCVVPAVAGTLMWNAVTNPDSGYINAILVNVFNAEPYPFYGSAETVYPTILMLSVFGWGGNMVMWLAQMQNVPEELYESADLDGASYFTKVFNITVPMTTSMIFYQLIMGIIGSLQTFSAYYPIFTNPANHAAKDQLNFIGIYIYETAFVGKDFSYGCTLSWLLFLVIGILTAVVFKTSKWVYYGEEN